MLLYALTGYDGYYSKHAQHYCNALTPRDTIQREKCFFRQDTYITLVYYVCFAAADNAIF